MIGKMNAEHWYLYITEPATQLTPPLTPQNETIDGVTNSDLLEMPGNSSESTPTQITGEVNQDETLEILMTDLDVDNAKQFYQEHAAEIAASKSRSALGKVRNNMIEALGSINEESDDSTYDVFEQTSSDHGSINGSLKPEALESTEGHALGAIVSDSCGLSDIYPTSRYPDARIDAFLFAPCGFSANGVIPAPIYADGDNAVDGACSSSRSTHYFTVHVTPE